MRNVEHLLFFAILLFSTNFLLAQCKCSANEAIDNIGEYCEVIGTILAIYQGNADKPIFLNFEKKFPNQVFSVVIYPDYLQYFEESPLNFEGKKVRVKGKIKLYNGKPQVEIGHSMDIESIE